MNLVKTHRIEAFLILAAMFFTFLGIIAINTAHANPSQFVGTTQTATASTSPAFMTPGTGTTTLVYDTFNTSTGNFYVNNLTELLLQFIASSTASQLNVNLEYANGYQNGIAIDCVANPNGCDWYEDNTTNLNGFATTTPNNIMAIIPQYQWKFASSTVGQLATPAGNNRATRALSINVPTRYVRAVFTCAAGGAGCAVWGQFVPVKETK